MGSGGAVLHNNLFITTFYCVTENAIGQEVLISQTERALEQLVPIIGHRMKLLNMLENLQKSTEADANNTRVEIIQEHEESTEKTPKINKEGDQQTRYRDLWHCSTQYI